MNIVRWADVMGSGRSKIMYTEPKEKGRLLGHLFIYPMVKRTCGLSAWRA